MVQIVFKPHNLDFAINKNLVAALLVIKGEENPDDPTLEQLINRGYKQDFLPQRVLHLLNNRANHFKNFTIANCINIDARLYY